MQENEIGLKLNKEREFKGFSYEKVSEDLKIQKRYLEALEKGDFEALPGEVYVKAFIKSYADYLGLNGRELVEEYKNFKKPVAHLEPEFLMHHPKIRDKRKRIPVHFEFTAEMKTGVLAVLGLCFLVAIVLMIKSCASMPGKPDLTRLETSNMPRLILNVETTGDCWFELTKDNEAPIKRQLTAGYKGEWAANEAFYVLVGDKNAVKMTFNGKPYPINHLNGENPVAAFTLKREEKKNGK